MTLTPRVRLSALAVAALTAATALATPAAAAPSVSESPAPAVSEAAPAVPDFAPTEAPEPATPQPAVTAKEGIFSTNCGFDHLAPDDPIVFPGENGAAHMHAFVGAKGVDEHSSPRTIQQGGTTCDRPKDKSAYWSPTLVKNGVYQKPTTAFVYYRTGGILDTKSIEPMPARLVMIAGDGHATKPQGINVTAWSCVSPGPKGENTEQMPRDCGDDPTRLLVRFPNCWDGVHLDSADHKSHMAYSWSDGTAGTCPRSHPVPVPRLQIAFRWNLPNGSGVALSSGGEFSAHMDFMNGWDQDKMRRLTERCLNTPKQCGTIA